MKKIIPFDNKYQFMFLEDKNIKVMHPVSNYFLKVNDLSVNLLISLKWIEWGYAFFSSISENIKLEVYNYQLEDIITNAIQTQQNNLDEEKHLILIDNEVVEDKEKLENLILNFYNKEFFDENTKIHIKLKINLREYIILSNLLFPTLMKSSKTIIL